MKIENEEEYEDMLDTLKSMNVNMKCLIQYQSESQLEQSKQEIDPSSDEDEGSVENMEDTITERSSRHCSFVQKYAESES